jgi:hypothetical protein
MTTLSKNATARPVYHPRFDARFEPMHRQGRLELVPPAARTSASRQSCQSHSRSRSIGPDSQPPTAAMLYVIENLPRAGRIGPQVWLDTLGQLCRGGGASATPFSSATAAPYERESTIRRGCPSLQTPGKPYPWRSWRNSKPHGVQGPSIARTRDWWPTWPSPPAASRAIWNRSLPSSSRGATHNRCHSTIRTT